MLLDPVSGLKEVVPVLLDLISGLGEVISGISEPVSGLQEVAVVLLELDSAFCVVKLLLKEAMKFWFELIIIAGSVCSTEHAERGARCARHPWRTLSLLLAKTLRRMEMLDEPVGLIFLWEDSTRTENCQVIFGVFAAGSLARGPGVLEYRMAADNVTLWKKELQHHNHIV